MCSNLNKPGKERRRGEEGSERGEEGRRGRGEAQKPTRETG
jgi:hypothetical protein